MQFGNEMQKNVHTMLATWFANDIKSGAIRQVPDHPVFLFQQGSTVVHVGVNPFGNDEASITVGSNVVTGAQVTPELMAFLLAHNHGSLFGAFGVHPENGTITLDHSIVGSTCDQKELMVSISFVAAAADKLDDIIIGKFGGKSALAVYTGQ
jgi:hypothetical protein